MGYRRQRKVYKLVFADPDMDGLVVRVRSVSVGTFFALAKADQQDAIEGLLDVFADALVDWNLEDDEGEPVPASLDGVRSQDVDFLMPIMRAWVDAIRQVPGPLGNGSSGGGRSLEASLPMEVRSPSP